ncbi:sigma-54 dependent transcriptional regulator [Vitiosangium sp. GDMCC 1.1324]|uniref:sigma-54-dependent transcriptional regulator n=1 Tax=Vitiosangium sp. (strain GDMCC 1.1324) TaxID=2138576 RepID=UPI000D3D2801|nr:sigma-54 dependent transcriptional regulator [Vitiosangium sp. GDMCC 1.1324]PTL83124.1 sigma-54-dependent Fis family transcriptional regulator [Vitiosangium sp. GDMCC 1.1324]
MRRRILVVDDELAVRFGIRHFFEAHGLEVIEAENCREARELFRGSRPDLVLLDYRLADGTALDLLPEMRAMDSSIPVLVLTAHVSIETAVQVIKQGAEHFLPKPVELPTLLVMVERLLEAQQARRRQQALVASSSEEINPFLGGSRVIRDLEATTRRVLDSDSPVLILGETGTGKGVLASWLHLQGPRSGGPLVQLNCAGLMAQFLETELFGHERGAFTSAVSRKQGLLEVAHRGTVFLDEIGDMDLQVQPKLLKVIEEKRFRRLGEVEDRSVDVRLIAATHQNLAESVRAQRFRGDLYFRISPLPLRIPSLRERPEDIPVIARAMLSRLSREIGRSGMDLTPAAESALRAYAWPGNLRELRNVLERAVLLSSTPVLGSDDLQFNHALARALPRLPAEAEGTLAGDPELDLTLQELERRHIERVLAAEGGHVERAARRLGIPRSSLYQKLKRLGLSSKV